jgi:hypothetical protein
MLELLVILEGRTDYALAVLKLWQRHLGDLEQEAEQARRNIGDLQRRLVALENVCGITHSATANE